MGNDFSHIDAKGNPTMVDISEKSITTRTASAQAVVIVNDEILTHFRGEDIQTKKGPVFQTAILAGIMGAKKTSDLIPLCHPLSMDNVQVDVQIDDKDQIVITTIAKTSGKTGVEMEALTAASVAALTIYDMCKAFSHDMTIQEVKLLKKTGGKSDYESA